jgi:glycosyltransferase involved in cell wall biosynthesis
MRVLHVINSLQTGGAERLLVSLLPRLRSLGAICKVLTVEDAEGPVFDQLLDAGVPVTTLGARSVYSLAGAVRTLSYLDQADFQVVHVHLFPAQLFAAITRSKRMAGWKLVLTEHATDNWRRSVTALAPVERWMYRQMDAIVCVSDAVKFALEDALGQQQRLEVVPNGIDAAAVKAAALEASDNSPAFAVLSAGRLVKEKGYDHLIDALPYIDSTATVAICGDGPLRQRLADRARHNTRGASVEVLGQRSDVFRLMSKAKVYVQPSLNDAFGLAALEAMSLGLPIVHSGCTGLADVVASGGISVDVHNPRAFGAAINRILHDAHFREQLAECAVARASEFSIDTTAARYFAIYQRVAGSLADRCA